MDVVHADEHRNHHALELDGGALIASWESPDRAEIVRRALEPGHNLIAPEALDRTLVGRVHDAAYVDFLESAWDRWNAEESAGPAAMGMCWPGRRFGEVRPTSLDGQLGYYSFAADCSIVAGTWTAAASSAAIAQTAAARVAGGSSLAFALCRPPGHHAMTDQFGGYCYLNNAAIAAQRLLDGGAGRVGIVDIDYHHGNGTQDIFYGRSDVAFASIHADPVQEFPYFLGHVSETGAADGEGFNRNEPLPWGTGVDEWLAALDRCLAWLAGHGIDAMVVSVGVDTFVDDPISRFTLDTGDYRAVGARLAAVNLPAVLVMEGGYATDALGVNVATVLDGFEGN